MSGPSVEGLSEQELLGMLPTTVSGHLATLDRQNVQWDQVGALLAGAPTSGVSVKGGGQWTGGLWQAVRHELGSFLCTDSEP